MRYVFMRYPGGVAKAVTFSYDDGTPEDERLARLFDKYGLKATFNFNSNELCKFNFTNDEIRDIFLSHGHEIAIHGAYHRANASVRPIEGIRDALDCRLELEERCGRIIRGMAYPDMGIISTGFGTSYTEIRSYLSQLGIAYARTLGTEKSDFFLPDDFYAWLPTAHHGSPKLNEYIDTFLELKLGKEVYCASRAPRLLFIWGHSNEFSDEAAWARMENICERLSGREDIFYATNIEIYEYVEAYRRLVYSADGKRIYNPTLHTLWFVADGVDYSISPGEEILLED